MYPLADAVLTEQCNQYSTCGLLSAYVGHKAVFNAEYHLKTSPFCPYDDAIGFNGARFNVGLAGIREPCQRRSSEKGASRHRSGAFQPAKRTRRSCSST